MSVRPTPNKAAPGNAATPLPFQVAPPWPGAREFAAGRNPRARAVFSSGDAALLLIHVHLAPGLCPVLLSSWPVRGKFRSGVDRLIGPDLHCHMVLAPRRLHCCPPRSGRTFRRHHTLPVAEETMILSTPNPSLHHSPTPSLHRSTPRPSTLALRPRRARQLAGSASARRIFLSLIFLSFCFSPSRTRARVHLDIATKE